ncbi:exonuclease domain-containing protein [Microbacterium sp. AK009]|uniref:exonuclease domain-containing protein n=1 Tax=Microbacterium sp. AK009 TaxID=2723068 RepID=UPI00211C7DD6|nr:exonuclease domain-containing protein [Microbacterium sp. AK009]
MRPQPTANGRSLPPHFAIIDVETTGLSPKADRIVELAVVRINQSGMVIDEWATRFNPEGPVGATHIHGISDADVAGAPLFRDLAPTLVPRIAGLPIAAHNARFDLAFLRAEFRRAGWDVPWLPAYCTLEGSHHYLPHLDRRRLIDCCWSAGVPLDNAHSALGDARATAALLGHYLQRPTAPHPLLASVRHEARAVAWPPGPSRASLSTSTDPAPRTRAARYTAPAPKQPALLAQLTKLSLVEVLEEGAPLGAVTYIETLLDVLEDGIITEAEAGSLQDLVEVYELSPEDVELAHHAFVLALAHRALDDGHVSRDERAQLQAVASTLSLSEKLVRSLIAEADAARAARLGAGLGSLPADWALGEPLRVGDKVVFTGCDERERERLENRARELGVRITGNVSGLTAMLVTDDSFDGTKSERARELGTRRVTPTEFALLLRYLQPALPSVNPATPQVPTTVTAQDAAPTVASTTASPTEIRAWGAANGHAVGVRGRLSAELVRAYELAHAAQS